MSTGLIPLGLCDHPPGFTQVGKHQTSDSGLDRESWSVAGR
jgi:hypothetical protein